MLDDGPFLEAEMILIDMIWREKDLFVVQVFQLIVWCEMYSVTTVFEGAERESLERE